MSIKDWVVEQHNKRNALHRKKTQVEGAFDNIWNGLLESLRTAILTYNDLTPGERVGFRADAYEMRLSRQVRSNGEFHECDSLMIRAYKQEGRIEARYGDGGQELSLILNLDQND